MAVGTVLVWLAMAGLTVYAKRGARTAKEGRLAKFLIIRGGAIGDEHGPPAHRIGPRHIEGQPQAKPNVFPRFLGNPNRFSMSRAYSRGERHSGIMEPISAGLSEEALREVARYYAAAVAADPAPPGVTDEAAIERGRLIAQHGIPAQRVPSCIDCHAPEGERYNANYPALEAQHADYLSLQLELFNKSHRGGSAYAHIMEPIAKRLKPQQMRDVALYFQSLRPRHTAQTHGRED